jgi:hypothetical protein
MGFAFDSRNDFDVELRSVATRSEEGDLLSGDVSAAPR